MANDIYSALKDGIVENEEIVSKFSSSRWSAVQTTTNLGICMFVPEADSYSFARINAYYNRGTDYYEPFDNYCTTGLDFYGKTVGVIGHLAEVKRRHGKDAKKIYYFELNPKDEEDLSADLEDVYLPDCDIVVITGSALVNGTLQHILDISQKAYKILVGPSVPKCSALLDFGIDRLAGMSVRDAELLTSHIKNDKDGTPYIYGNPFLIKK